MVIAGIPREEIRHTRAVQDWLAEGRQEGRQAEASSVALRLLNRRSGPLSEATTAQIRALQIDKLEALAGRQTAQPDREVLKRPLSAWFGR